MLSVLRYTSSINSSRMSLMATATKRKTSLTLDAEALDAAREYGVNISSVAQAVLNKAVADARREQWLKENEAAFKAQAEWHEMHGHPLADIMMSPAGETWKR